MTDESKINDEVAKTLSQLQPFEEIQVPPYFFQGIKAKMEGRARQKKFALPQAVRLAPVLLAVFILLNIFSTIYIFSRSQEKNMRDDYLNKLAQDYGFVESAKTEWISDK